MYGMFPNFTPVGSCPHLNIYQIMEKVIYKFVEVVITTLPQFPLLKFILSPDIVEVSLIL